MALNINRYSSFMIPARRVAGLVVIMCMALASQAQVYTLDSVLALVERNNPALREADSRVAAMEAYVGGARSWMAPMVGGGTFMTPYPGDRSMTEEGKGSWMFSLEQEIPNPAKQKATERYLHSRAKAEEEGRAMRFNDLRSEARLYYYGWLVNEERLNVLRQSEEIVSLMLKLARIRYPYNQGSLGNIYKAEGRLAEVQNEMLMTEGAIESARSRLRALMALPASTPLRIDTATTVAFRHDPSDYDTATLRLQRSDIRQLDARIVSARLNQQVRRFQAKPDFKIRFDHMQPIGNMPPQYSIMAMVSIPIAPWSAKMYKSEVGAMDHEIAAITEGRDAMLIAARGALAAMASRIQRMEEQLDNYVMKIIPALQKNYKTVMLAYEENREALPVVIEAWEALNMAQMEYLSKKEEYYTMIVAYEKEIEK